MTTMVALLLAVSAGRSQAESINYGITKVTPRAESLGPGGAWSVICEDAVKRLRTSVPAKDPRLAKAKKCVSDGNDLWVRARTLLPRCQALSDYLMSNDSEAPAASEAGKEYQYSLKQAPKCVTELQRLELALDKQWKLTAEVRNNPPNFVEKF